MGNRRARSKPRPSGLATRRVWIAVVVASTIAIAVGVLMETSALSERRDLASDRALTLAQRTLVPALSGTDLSRPPTGARSQQLQGLLNSVLLGSEAENVVVWSPQGFVVMSDRASQVGSEARAPDALKRALRGRTFAYAIGNEFRVVVPIRPDPETAPNGVVVVVYDDAGLRAAAANPGRVFTYGATALLLVALGLAPIVFRGTAAALRRRPDTARRGGRGGAVRLPAGPATAGARRGTPTGAPPKPPGPPTREPEPPPFGDPSPSPPIGVPPSPRELKEAKERAWKADERAALAERQAATAQESLEQIRAELRRVTEEAHQLRGKLEAAGVSARGEPSATLEHELRALQEEAVTLRANLAKVQAQLEGAEMQRREAEDRLREVLAAQAMTEASAAASAVQPVEVNQPVEEVAGRPEVGATTSVELFEQLDAGPPAERAETAEPVEPFDPVEASASAEASAPVEEVAPAEASPSESDARDHPPQTEAPGPAGVPAGVPDYVIAAERAAVERTAAAQSDSWWLEDRPGAGPAVQEPPPDQPKRHRRAIAARLADALHLRAAEEPPAPDPPPAEPPPTEPTEASVPDAEPAARAPDVGWASFDPPVAEPPPVEPPAPEPQSWRDEAERPPVEPYHPDGGAPLPAAHPVGAATGDAAEGNETDAEPPELTEEERLKLREQMMRRRSREEFRRRQLGSPGRGA